MPRVRVSRRQLLFLARLSQESTHSEELSLSLESLLYLQLPSRYWLVIELGAYKSPF